MIKHVKYTGVYLDFFERVLISVMLEEKKLEKTLKDLKKTRNVSDFIELLKIYKYNQIMKEVSDIFDGEEGLKNKLKLLFGLKFSEDVVEWSDGYFRICVEELDNGFNKDLKEKLFNLFDCSEESSSGRSFSEAFAGLLYELQCEDGNLNEALLKIIEETELIVTESPEYHYYSSQPQFNEANNSNILNIGMCVIRDACDAKADKVLKLVLRIGQSHEEFSEEDKVIIGKLMMDAVVPIQRYIRRVLITYGHRSYPSIQRKKAALERIFKEYATYTPLSVYKIPEYNKLLEGIEALTKVNKDYCDSSNSDSDSSNSA
ncbi:uncharacterized protein [Parasteatoda tepidariorum]|uniref:uncharacterized protein isoform X2 n=1 Tax=Parasteatoda tepidariorum TaxID=114398 RepID=UPI0039BC93A1